MAAATKARRGRAATASIAGYFRDPDGNKLNAFRHGLELADRLRAR